MKYYEICIQINRNDKLWHRRINSKLKRSRRKGLLNELNAKEKKSKLILERKFDFEKIIAPKNFSFIECTEGVVSFINRLFHCYENRRKVFVVLKQIETLTQLAEHSY